MVFRRLGGALLQRLLLFLMAGLVAVTLLHVPAGIIAPKSKTEPVTYAAERWVDATKAYLTALGRGDLGTLKRLGVQGYQQDQPVTQLLAQQVPRSGFLLASALILSLSLGTLLGYLSSRFGNRWLRSLVLTSTLLLLSFPDILMVFLLRSFVAWGLATFGVKLLGSGSIAGLPVQDLIGPVLALSALPLAVVARLAAVAFDDVYNQFYVRTAHSKGLHPMRVVLKHVLRNAWIQVADAGPMIVGSLVTGLVVVEYAFYYPGLGRTLGLMLERGGQPGAASSVALALLVGAILTDTLFGMVRMALDPRLGERERDRHEGGGGRFRLSDLRFSPAAALRQFWLGLKELPYAISQTAWTARPSYLLRGIWRNPPLLIGLIGVLTLVALALFGGQLADLRATGSTPKYILHNKEVFFPPFKPGLTGYPLGSDMAGRDLLSRLLVGARYTLFFTLAVTPVRFLIAVPWGLLAGFWRGGWAGSSRTLGLMFSALPVMLIPAALLPLQSLFTNGAVTGYSFWLVTIILAAAGVPRLVESVRQQVESTLVLPFIEGARATGASTGRILRKHVLPHLSPQLWVMAAADMAWTLLLLAQLGVFSIYLGGAVSVDAAYGVTGGPVIPRIPDWSSMLSKPYEVIYRAPWAIRIPALVFLLAIVIFNLTAEGLRRQAQNLSVKAALPEPETLPDGTERIPVRAKRRLALEWTATAVLTAMLVGVTVQYGGAEAPPPPAELTALDRAKRDLTLVLETIYGTGGQFERAKAVSQMQNVVIRYLQESFRVKQDATQIQGDSQGRVNLFPFDDVLVVQFQAPTGILSDGAFHSFIWVQDRERGQVTPMNVAVKPVYIASANGVLLMAGTVPGPDNWEIMTLSRMDTGGWMPDSDLAARLVRKIPKEYNAVQDRGIGNSARPVIALTGGPLNSARLDPSGDVTVCIDTKGPCTTVPFKDFATR